MERLDRALSSIVLTDSLLVAVDFDGTLAPIVKHPDDAVANEQSLGALTRLGAMSRTTVAVVTGRSLDDLTQRLPGIPSSFVLVGSHGAEFAAQSSEVAATLSDEEQELVRNIRDAVASAAEGLDGLLIEHKGGSSTLHYRTADRDIAALALRRLCRSKHDPRLAQASFRRGKKVVEVFAVHIGKGSALRQLRELSGATASVYVGDDRTDEDAFAVMDDADLAVKVGTGPTAAPFRVDTPRDVARLLVRLADGRHGAQLQSGTL